MAQLLGAEGAQTFGVEVLGGAGGGGEEGCLGLEGWVGGWGPGQLLRSCGVGLG